MRIARDAAVHHVGRRDEVGAGHGVRQRGSRQLFDRGVVDDLVAVDDAAVAVRGVLAQADVGHDEEVADLALECAHGRSAPAHPDRAAAEPSGSFCVGQAEQDDRRHAVRLRGRGFLDGFVDRELKHAGHRADLPPDAVAFADEQRVDEAVGRQPRLAYQRADGLGAAEPARTARQ